MVISKSQNSLVHSIKLSSVGPGYATGSDVVHEPSGLDLALKLHYVRGVYVFRSHAVQGLTTMSIKEITFYWLNEYYVTCARFRRMDSGRPYLKCNDCGARFVEAQCDQTVDEVLEMKDYCSLQKFLVYHQPIGPELSFSPPIYLQITWFKCGGMSLGLSWAHILGDPFSACDAINKWGQVVASIQAHGLPTIPKLLPTRPSTLRQKPENPLSLARSKDPISIKRVSPVGDHWVTPNNCKMDTFSFPLTPTQISHLQSKLKNQHPIPIFESLCAIIWKSIAKIRDGFGPNTVTICKKGSQNWKNGNNLMSNGQIVSAFEADFNVMETDLEKLAKVLFDEAAVVGNERSLIEETMEEENGVSDFIFYGANLTFMKWEEADIYELELNGERADFACYSIEGVGDEGAVIVLPWRKDSDKEGGKGRFVTIILPEEQLLKLIPEMKKNGLLLETNL